jgi:formylglycine-generating enzyme required for sulfatase activity
LASSFQDLQSHWRINAEEEGCELYFTITDPTTHRSLRDDPIMPDQPIHSIPYEATEAYADWLYERLRAQGYEGPRPRPPTVTELEILSRQSFPWTFPWGYHFRRTFISSRLVHRDLVKDTFAHPVGDHPLGPELYRDYSLYEGRDEQGRPLRLGHLVGGVREWTSSVTEQNAVHQYGGSPRTPAGSFFLPSARMYFPKDVTDDLHGGFRLVIPFPPSPRPPAK